MRPGQPVQSAGAGRERVVPFRDPGAGAQLLLTTAEFAAYERELRELRDNRSQTRLRIVAITPALAAAS